MRFYAVTAALLLTTYASTSVATDLQQQLNLITETANKLCNEVPLQGNTSANEVSGKVSAEVRGLMRKLVDAGAQAEGRHESQEFQGLLQKDLLEALRDRNNCKLHVWTDLKDKLLGEPHAAATPHPPAFESRKYLNTTVSRIAGKVSVAISLQGSAGSDTAPFEAAMRRALDQRGYQVIPVFRTEFQHAGLGQQLFSGDPALAMRLKLQNYCDWVLLGVLRFVGPAQQVAGGLYIREVVLDIHSIDPLSGDVGRALEIREKGGGTSEQLSTQNALDRLQNSVETSVKEWTWT